MNNDISTEKEARKELFEVYKITVDFLKFEATTLWQIFNAFLIANTILLGFISTSLAKKEMGDLNYGLFITVGIVGIIISLCWLGTFYRNSDWYDHRMKQAKKIEIRLIDKDDSWSLLTGESEKKSTGLSNKAAGYTMIALFGAIYFVVIIWSIIMMNCHC